MATLEENISRGRVCEKRTNTSPVASAVSIRLVTDSATTNTFAKVLAGYMVP